MKKSVLVEKLGDRIAFHFCKEPGTGEYDYLAEQLLETLTLVLTLLVNLFQRRFNLSRQLKTIIK